MIRTRGRTAAAAAAALAAASAVLLLDGARARAQEGEAAPPVALPPPPTTPAQPAAPETSTPPAPAQPEPIDLDRIDADLGSSDAAVRAAAVQALASAPDLERALGIAVRGLFASDPIRAGAAEAAFGALPASSRAEAASRLIVLLDHPEEPILLRVMRAIARLGPAAASEAGERLEVLARDPRQAGETRVEALRTLRTLERVAPDAFARLLVELVTSEDAVGAAEGAAVLAELPREAIVPLLAGTLAAPNRGARLRSVHVVRALRLLELREGVERLARDRDQGVRAAALATLGVLGDARSVRFLVEAAGDASAPASVREAACRALGRSEFRSEEVSAALVRRLDDPDLAVHLAAIHALERAGTGNAVARVNQDRGSPRESVSQAARRTGDALAERGVFRPGSYRPQMPTEQKLELPAHMHTEPDRRWIPALIEMLGDLDPNVRARALRVLHRHVPPERLERPEGEDPFGFDPDASPQRRSEAQRRWEAWWREARDGYEVPR